MSNYKKRLVRVGGLALGVAALVAVQLGLAPDAEAANGLRRVVLRANGL